MDGTKISINQLKASWGDKTILENYNLEVYSRDVVAILGANGVGKSTLLSCITNSLKPSGGTVSVDGDIGFVPQLFNIPFSFKVIDVVLMGRCRHIGLLGTPKAKDYSKAHKILDMLKIDQLSNKGFNELSGGQRQMVMIAQALISDCDILILDEPCSALDYKNQGIVLSLLEQLHQKNDLTILYTTHNPHHAVELSTKVLLMASKKDYHYGISKDILTTEHLSNTYKIDMSKATTEKNNHTFIPKLV